MDSRRLMLRRSFGRDNYSWRTVHNMKFLPNGKSASLAVLICFIAVGLLAHGQLCSGQTIRLKPADSWMAEKWTGADAPFTLARTRITAEMLSSADPDSTYGKYQAAANADPKNALAAFSFSVAAEVGTHLNTTLQSSTDMLTASNQAMAVPASPKTYEYARMRFLSVEACDRFNPDLVFLAKRLLKANGNDPQILMGAAICYAGIDKQHAIDLANKAIRLDPSNWMCHVVLASLYQQWFFDDQHRRDGEMAISEYQKSLPTMPKGNYSYSVDPLIIAGLESELKNPKLNLPN